MDLVNGVKNTEIAPKYAPNRLFRKGDKVRVVEWNGRDIARVGQIGYVVSNECNSRVELSIDGWKNSVYYPACHLELVTPVEEREPYKVEESIFIKDEWKVWKDGGDETQTLIATYTLAHPNAKAAAEAECDRLNAEYGKEMGK